MTKEYGVVLFHTTSAALRSERVLQEAGFEIKLIPVPRQFSSDCGIAARFDWREADAVQETLEANNIEIAAVHEL